MEQNNIGNVKISEDVIYKIAINAALETEGVSKVTSKKADNAKEFFEGMKYPKGLLYKNSEDGIILSICVSLKYGVVIPDVAAAVQKNVAEAITNMTGLNVAHIDVVVTGVIQSNE